MTTEEARMLEFAIKWAPFGGGDENILIEFGIVPAAFYGRLQDLLARSSGLNSSVWYRLNELCTSKLASGSLQRSLRAAEPAV